MDRIYCGTKVFVPHGYDRFGDRFECLRCGYGSAMMQFKWAPASHDPRPPPRNKKGCYRKKKRRGPASSRKSSSKKKRRSPPSSRKSSSKKKRRSPPSSRKSSSKKKRRSPPSSRKSSSKKKRRSPPSSRKSSSKKKRRSPPSSRANSWQDWLQTPGDADPDALFESPVFGMTPRKLDFETEDIEIEEDEPLFDIPNSQDDAAWSNFFDDIQTDAVRNPYYLNRLKTDLAQKTGKRIPKKRDFFVPGAGATQ